MTVYRCRDSLESIFTAIYRVYEDGRHPEDACLALHDEPLLFAEDVWVQPDMDRYLKVMSTLKRRFGEKDYLSLCLTLASADEDKAQAVYRTVALGLADHCSPGHLFDRLSDPHVMKAFSLARKVGREEEHLRGFLRFKETEAGILYADIGPVNNVLTFIMPHFADRLSTENFVIHDDRRDFFGVHPAGKQWYLLSGEETQKPDPSLSQEERRYRELFGGFVQSIAIRERKNLALQRNMMPLRYQKYMVEFQQKDSKM